MPQRIKLQIELDVDVTDPARLERAAIIRIDTAQIEVGNGAVEMVKGVFDLGRATVDSHARLVTHRSRFWVV